MTLSYALLVVAVVLVLLRLLSTDFPHVIYVVIFACLMLYAYWLVRQASSNPYGLFHLSLNKIPGDDGPPRTEWLNMGFWKDTNIFPEACSALAIKLIQAAGCETGDRILDVGHGTGESLLLLLSSQSLPRPSTITGITSIYTHHLRSQKRVDHLRSSSNVELPIVHLYAGDAVYDGKAIGHPLNPSSADMFETILALDCAYHFNTRETFLRQSLQKLAPGGKIALADICFKPGKSKGFLLWTMVSLFKLMPEQNVVSIQEYVTQMKGIGYVNVQQEDITLDVFPGFIRFLKSQGLGWKVFGWILEMYVSAGAQFVIIRGSTMQAT